MSDREKKTLIIFGLAAFVMLNFLGFNFAVSKRGEVDRARAQAEQQLDQAIMFQENSEKVSAEMDWLSTNEPETIANQDIQAKLQQFADSGAKSFGLNVKAQKLLPSDVTEGRNYHRAKCQFVVTGTEQSLYQWFDKLNDPFLLRIATQIRLSPNQQDDTKIDCTATIEQWFTPPAP
ncbi:hypothetical protein JIN84_11040 [Luteolibacter yonseiensis]|uniref:Uncharacterized protein n=1 Tax=Luteolibacter yonseiensis TaxID=1144680 RepID=A0A934R3D4_9BACT|nr:hypothetical protein [Luteolibacter yonseiensis]MBK1816149.1 hypothetical protein [Luteolibacter yonseiensis]